MQIQNEEALKSSRHTCIRLKRVRRSDSLLHLQSCCNESLDFSGALLSESVSQSQTHTAHLSALSSTRLSLLHQYFLHIECIEEREIMRYRARERKRASASSAFAFARLVLLSYLSSSHFIHLNLDHLGQLDVSRPHTPWLAKSPRFFQWGRFRKKKFALCRWLLSLDRRSGSVAVWTEMSAPTARQKERKGFIFLGRAESPHHNVLLFVRQTRGLFPNQAELKLS